MNLSLPLPVVSGLLIGGAVLVHFLLRGLLFTGSRPRRQANPLVVLLGTGVLVAGAIVAFSFAQADVQRYRDDPSCTLGFSGSVQPAGSTYGACHLESASIVRAYTYYGRRSTHRVLTLRRSDGSELDVEPSGSTAYQLYQAARAQTITAATVQFYRDSAVELMTGDGVTRTTSHPQTREHTFALFGILAGIFGLVFAAGTIVRSLF